MSQYTSVCMYCIKTLDTIIAPLHWIILGYQPQKKIKNKKKNTSRVDSSTMIVTFLQKNPQAESKRNTRGKQRSENNFLPTFIICLVHY